MKYILGAYSQIPCGATENECEILLKNQLKPLLKELYNNDKLCFVLSLSLNYFEWLEEKHPEIFMLMRNLCKKNRLEILATSAYGAILPLIPAHERTRYIEKTTSYISKKFAKKPRGFFNNYQIFSPSVIGSISLSSLDYMIISPYNRMSESVLKTNPFYMNEIVKSCFIFPIDDRFSKEVYEFWKNRDESEKLAANIEKIARDCTVNPTTIMLNLDQLSSLPDLSELFSKLFGLVGDNSVLPSTFLDNKEIAKEFYLPAGVYGRDFDIGKAFSVNQIIEENKMLHKEYALLNVFRDSIKNIKKNTDERKQLDRLIFNAGAGSVYLSDNCLKPEIKRFHDKQLCEIEKLLYENGELQSQQNIGLNSGKNSEYIVGSKYGVAHVNPKGAIVDRITWFGFLHNFCLHDGDMPFFDVFKDKKGNKVLSVGSKMFDFTDKQKHELSAFCSKIDVDGIGITINKTFRFRTSSFSADIEITNNGNIPLVDYTYENMLNVSCTSDYFLYDGSGNIVSDGAITDCIEVKDEIGNFKLTWLFSEKVSVFYKTIEKVGADLQKYYQFHRIKISKVVNIKPSEKTSICITMKVEQLKK